VKYGDPNRGDGVEGGQGARGREETERKGWPCFVEASDRVNGRSGQTHEARMKIGRYAEEPKHWCYSSRKHGERGNLQPQPKNSSYFLLGLVSAQTQTPQEEPTNNAAKKHAHLATESVIGGKNSHSESFVGLRGPLSM